VNQSDRFIARAGTGGQHITLVDDVITTGATIEAAVAACEAAGAKSVEVWALARTPVTAHAG
jgi:predicted amidophosphoribosyltransferase